ECVAEPKRTRPPLLAHQELRSRRLPERSEDLLVSEVRHAGEDRPVEPTSQHSRRGKRGASRRTQGAKALDHRRLERSRNGRLEAGLDLPSRTGLDHNARASCTREEFLDEEGQAVRALMEDGLEPSREARKVEAGPGHRRYV